MKPLKWRTWIALLVCAISVLARARLLAAAPAQSQSSSTQQQIESHSRQAQEFLRTKQPDLAIGEFNAILALDPNNAEAHANLGVVLFFENQYARAATELQSALQLRPSLWNIQALLGMCERRLGQTGAARGDLEKAFPELQDEKLRVRTGMELIEIYYAAGDLDKAAGVVGVLRQLRPADLDILYTAHRIYSDLASESMLNIAMSAPKSARMHQVIAQQLVKEGNNEAAIAHYREALKSQPGLPDLHFELAELLSVSSSSSDQAAAEKEYQAALAGNSLDEKSECGLGDIAFRAADLKAALARYSRAVNLQPDDATANFGLGRTLMSMHEPEKAEPYLRRASQLDPFDAVIHYHLASVYRALGRASDASRELGEFQRLREMKEGLRQLYSEMHLTAGKQERPDPDVPR